MEIRDFKYVRVGSGWPAAIDVGVISDHESHGLVASTTTYRHPNETGFAQFRVHNSSSIAALFVFKFDDQKLSAFWEDSKVIWDSRDVA